MSIETQLEELNQIKSDILTSIAGKGVTVPVNSGLKDAAGLIDTIEQGGSSIPDDIKLYEILKNTASYFEDIFNIPFTSNNTGLTFIAKYSVDSFSGNSNIGIFCGGSGYTDAPSFQLAAGNGVTSHHFSNKPNSSNLFNVTGTETGVIKTLALKNNVAFEYFTGTTKASNIPYVSFDLTRLGILTIVQGIVNLYTFAIKDSNDEFLLKLQPAKKDNKVGLFDTISNVFYEASNQSNLTVENEMI